MKSWNEASAPVASLSFGIGKSAHGKCSGFLRVRFTGYLKLLEIEEPLEAVLVEGLLFLGEVLLGEAVELAVGLRLGDEGVQLE